MLLNNTHNILYIELVLDKSLEGSLAHVIGHQHITLIFNPTDAQASEYISLIETGKTIYSYESIGYGNDGINEGYSVVIKEEIPYYNTFRPHITTAVAEGASAIGTGSLKFKNINKKFSGTCHLNIFYNDMTPEA